MDSVVNPKEDDSRKNSSHGDGSEATALSVAAHKGAGETVKQALPIVPVRLKSKYSDKYVTTYAFLDSGSNATFCLETPAHSLNIEGKRTKLNLVTMGQEKVQDAYVISDLESTLPVSRKDVISPEDLKEWPHLHDIDLNVIECDVGLLIGVNAPKALEPWDVVPSAENGPFTVKTLLGWVINGPLEVTPNDNNDRKFLDLVSKSICFEDGHYQIGLPFKSNDVRLPNNKKQAEQRLSSLVKRFNHDENFHSEYCEFMNKIMYDGYAIKVSTEDTEQVDGKVWYLPHHGVYHPKKKKLRVVFDCAARFQGTSLNDQLLPGPNLTSSLVGTLLRFRQEEIAVMGDIDSMFYQVHVPKQDASFLRFLWWEDGDTTKKIVEYQMVVHLFGASSSPSCANYALRKTARDSEELFNSEIINTVFKNFYVDDCLKSVKNVDYAIDLIKDIQRLLTRGGFHISKWISNNRDVMMTIPISERAKEVKGLDLDYNALPMERAVGVQWCVESDVFRFNIEVNKKPLTRRGILSMISSVFDPLGFLAPFVLRAKKILKELSIIHLGWDDTTP
ncbi:uncharacterized protein LOC134267449 [Saccostrea cucullata]|uniref:uncharacterized protein LOC134267449 n=1 Tax=Saccostrea cuccullata TaxID=36930 RepID=UPI002ED53D4B